MGTMIQRLALTEDDFGGPEYEGCNENLVLTRPDAIRGIHRAYLEAGADIIETNTFGATSVVLAEYGLAHKAREINRVAAELARAEARAFSTEAKPRWVAGAIGPTTKTLTVTGGVTFDALRGAYREQALGLLEGGVDALLVETSQDTLNVKAAALGISDAQLDRGRAVPLMLSLTIEPTGTMLAGQGVDAAWTALRHFRPVSIGLNCATGPEFMTDHLRTLAELADVAVTIYPNAGLPDEDGQYEETPDSFARKLGRFLDEGWVNLVGGCCGTTPAHIARLAEVARGRAPRAFAARAPRAVSGVDYLEVTDDATQRPILVGERTNVIGSRKFKRLVAEKRLDEGAEVGRAQAKAGAQVLDVCLADPDRDEAADMDAFLPVLLQKVKLPVMVDTTDVAVLELALKRIQGKAIVNSVNLEDGEERFEKVCPLARAYGAALVVGCIDEDKAQGMAVTRERKLAVAERSYRLLTEKYGIPPEDIVFDPLVFPAGTGDANYVGSARETIEGVRLIAERFPRCSTILGVSNVSFGLPPAGREVLNAVFLYECVQAGLTFAIVNTEGLARYASIPEGERRLAEDVLYSQGDDPIGRFSAHFRGREGTKKTKVTKPEGSLDERLARYIVEGTREGLAADLDRKLAEGAAPLDIINGPLMKGMGEVGRLFNANELIVAEVLQSAEAMKASVAHLRPHMPRTASATRGKIVLATVKGDVHDIGKNLVEIILSNNGYDIVNLGIKVPPEELVRAVAEHRPDAIGLSGLLVKSAQQMAITARDLRAAGVDVPLLVGGAALTSRFTATRIAPEYGAPVLYAKDAMVGLDLANRLLGAPEGRAGLLESVRTEQARLAAP
ncbi:MAG TPA: homocysteine S-methyltransferase family protein, partial [Candidatus Thermoplasmatota archaeon]|nr:homocysteine S-methyltransferase family protein [Candidatus Thermoplasmatota archaeon]